MVGRLTWAQFQRAESACARFAALKTRVPAARATRERVAEEPAAAAAAPLPRPASPEFVAARDVARPTAAVAASAPATQDVVDGRLSPLAAAALQLEAAAWQRDSAALSASVAASSPASAAARLRLDQLHLLYSLHMHEVAHALAPDVLLAGTHAARAVVNSSAALGGDADAAKPRAHRGVGELPADGLLLVLDSPGASSRGLVEQAGLGAGLSMLDAEGRPNADFAADALAAMFGLVQVLAPITALVRRTPEGSARRDGAAAREHAEISATAPARFDYSCLLSHRHGTARFLSPAVTRWATCAAALANLLKKTVRIKIY